MRRNILLIIIDQFRADLITGALSAAIDLPNLRAFRRESVAFDNHFTVTTPCGPSRASLLTGQYAMNHRSVRNGTPLAAHHATIATEARKAGYEPLLFGYTDTAADPDFLHPNDPELRSYEGLAPGFAEILRMRFEETGSWQADLKAKGYHLPASHFALFAPVADGGGRPAISDPALYRAEDSDTAFLADQTIKELAVREGKGWFATTTFIRPHPPFVAPAPYNTAYRPAAMPMPRRRASVAETRAAHPFYDAYFAAPSNHGLYIGFDGRLDVLPDADMAELRAVYFGLAAEVDAHIGRMVAYLKSSGQWDNTTVIITADHGEMLGDHFMWGKNAPHDGALKIPLMIRDPDHAGSAGQVVTEMTESIDTAATLLDLIDIPAPAAMNGQTLRPFLSGRAPDRWRDCIFAEIDLADPARDTIFQRHLGLPLRAANYAILREARLKYVHFNGGLPPLLFDLETDPGEARNLADDPAYRADLHRLAVKMLDHRMSFAHSAQSRRAITGAGVVEA